MVTALFKGFIRVDVREINAALTVFAATFFCKQIPVHQPANVKHGGGEYDQNYNCLDIHDAKLIHFM